MNPPRPDTIGDRDAADPRYPYLAEIEAERVAWYELTDLVRSLTPEECLVPGYYRDPDWSVRDVASHLGTWLAEAEVQFERIHAETYEGHDVDIDALNASFLAAMRGPALGGRLDPGERRADQDAPGLAAARRAKRRGGLVDPEVGGRALRRASRSAP